MVNSSSILRFRFEAPHPILAPCVIVLVLIVFITFVAGQHPSLNRLLDWHELRGDVTTGWTLGLCWMLDSLITYATAFNSV